MNLFRLKALLYGPKASMRGKCPKCGARALGARFRRRTGLLDYYCHDCAYSWSGTAPVLESTAATSGKDA